MSDYGHLDVTMTQRGFKHLPPVPARRDAGAVSVYEASHAETPCIWLKTEDEDDREIILALEAEKAWALAEQIMYLVKNHYHGDSTPEWAEGRATDEDT